MKITETERLYIEEAEVADAGFFRRLMNTEGWLSYIGNRHIHSDADAATYIFERIIKSYQTNGFGLYVMKIKSSFEPVGICGFVKRDYLTHADFGFAILPGYEGKGYMKEAAEKLIEYGFAKLSFDEIWAITHPANNRSQQLLYKLGFQKTGEFQPDKNKPADFLFAVKNTASAKPF